QPFVRAEGLLVYGGQRRFVDVSAWHVPPRREARFVEHQWSLGVGDRAIPMVDDKVTGSLSDVDAVVAVRGMPDDSFVLFIEGLHGSPGERDPAQQFPRMRGQLNVLPGSSRRVVLASANRIPGCETEVRMSGCVFSSFEDTRRNL